MQKSSCLRVKSDFWGTESLENQENLLSDEMFFCLFVCLFVCLFNVSTLTQVLPDSLERDAHCRYKWGNTGQAAEERGCSSIFC